MKPTRGKYFGKILIGITDCGEALMIFMNCPGYFYYQEYFLVEDLDKYPLGVYALNMWKNWSIALLRDIESRKDDHSYPLRELTDDLWGIGVRFYSEKIDNPPLHIYDVLDPITETETV